jgi:thiol:disulfide interchange protein
VAIVATALLAGLLVAGKFYPEPGVPVMQGLVLLAAPVWLLAGALMPVKRPWVRGVVGLLLVVIAVAAVTGPAALAAKKAAEASPADPYGAYR